MKKLPLVPIGTEVQSAETGSWRTYKPVVKKEACKKCGLCIMFCPDGVIFKTEDGVEVDYVFCKGCGICAKECPTKAIEMILEEE
jgi:2-oxoacid:acceptor oxidoreductase delta subunit (pyruvate/2-ketoisovalerate family)